MMYEFSTILFYPSIYLIPQPFLKFFLRFPFLKWKLMIYCKGLFIWGEASDLSEMSHVSEILFTSRLQEENIPPEWDTIHSS